MSHRFPFPSGWTFPLQDTHVILLGSSSHCQKKEALPPPPKAAQAQPSSDCCQLSPATGLKEGMGRVVVTYPADATSLDARLDVYNAGDSTSIGGAYGNSAVEISPGTYDKGLAGVRQRPGFPLLPGENCVGHRQPGSGDRAPHQRAQGGVEASRSIPRAWAWPTTRKNTEPRRSNRLSGIWKSRRTQTMPAGSKSPSRISSDHSRVHSPHLMKEDPMHTTSSNLHYSETDASRTRGRVPWPRRNNSSITTNVTWRQDMKTINLTFVSLLSALFITLSTFTPGYAAPAGKPLTKKTASCTRAECQQVFSDAGQTCTDARGPRMSNGKCNCSCYDVGGAKKKITQ